MMKVVYFKECYNKISGVFYQNGFFLRRLGKKLGGTLGGYTGLGWGNFMKLQGVLDYKKYGQPFLKHSYTW